MAKRTMASTILSLTLAAALLLALGLLALVGCGGDETTSGSEGSGDGQVLVDEASVAKMSPSAFQQVLTTAADRMIENLGGDDPALYAALLAVDRGYDAYQLLTGALNDQVQADGRIFSADGMLLSPARETEMIIHIPGDQAESGPQDGGASDEARSTGADQARASERQILLVSLSGAVLRADAGDLEDATVTTSGISELPIGDALGVIETAMSDEYAKVAAERAQAAAESKMQVKHVWIAMILAARGYSAEQIVEAAILGQIRIFLDPDRETACWYIEHTSGVVLGPVNPPLDIFEELSCPAAGKTAPMTYDPRTVGRILDQWGLGEFAPPPAGSGSAANGSSASGGDAGAVAGGGSDEQPAGGGSAAGEPEFSSPGEEGKAWVFEGTGLLRQSTSTKGAEVCEDPACPYVLTLFPDGRAELHVTRGFGWENGECVERPGNIYVGTWWQDSFEILGQFDAGGPIVDPSFLVSGKYAPDLATGSGGYDNEAGFSAVFDFEEPGLERKID